MLKRALLILSLAACGATPDEPGPETAEVQDFVRPWPQDFMDEGLLVANDIYIEGPRGLLDHLALAQDDSQFNYTVETLPAGFRQELRKKPSVDFAEIRAALDKLEITSLGRIVVLERPGDVAVRNVAKGDVWFHGVAPTNLQTGIERNTEVLDWRGDTLELSSR